MNPLLKTVNLPYTTFSITPFSFHGEGINRFEYPLGVATENFIISVGYTVFDLGTSGIKVYVRFANGNYLFFTRINTGIQTVEIGKYEVGVGETILHSDTAS